jgi:SAM-dependent methyltransferase
MTPTDYAVTDSEYLHQNPTWHVEDSPWKATQIINIMEKNNLQPKTVVEIGCGAGEILNQLHQRLPDQSIAFSGYEIAPDAFRLMEQRKKDRLEFFQENLLTTDKHFDLLLMIDVFEHVDDYLGFIRSASQKATYKIYHIPLDISMFSIAINNFKHVRKSVGHLHYFNKETALATIRDSGQEVIDWAYTKTALEVNNKGLTLFNRFCNFLRRIFYPLNKDFAANTMGGFSLIVLAR